MKVETKPDGTFRGTILIVEDDPELLELTGRVLAKSGFRPVCVTDGKAALAALGELEAPPDAILSDMNLPGEITGAELIARIREFAGAAVPALIVTADPSPEARRAAAALGCGLLVKPVTGDRLRRELVAILGRPA